MGTFIGHVAPGLAFTFLGLWHLLNTINSYKLKPSNFISKPWFPLTTSTPLKHLELYLLFLFSILAIVLNLLHPSLEALQHATMFLHLAIYASAAIAADYTSSPDSHTGLITTLLASVFAQELFLLHIHNHTGLEGHYHWLLQLIVGASLLISIITIGFPMSFTAAVVRSGTVVMQGLWFVNMGFVLWYPGVVASETEEAGKLANLQLSWLVAVVSVVTAVLCVLPDWKCTEYRMLQCKFGGEVEGAKKVLNAAHEAV